MAITTDFQSVSYNSYVDVPESDLIFEKYSVYYPNVKWFDLSDEEKESWLLSTATEVNVDWRYEGELSQQVISANSGGMQWPRKNADHANGLPVAETETPNGIKEFQVVRALEYLSNPNLVSVGLLQGSLKRQKLDVLEQEFYNTNATSSGKDTASSKHAKRTNMMSYKLIEPYLSVSSKSTSTKPLVRA